MVGKGRVGEIMNGGEGGGLGVGMNSLILNFLSTKQEK